jgi:hypothetical protein
LPSSLLKKARSFGWDAYMLTCSQIFIQDFV